MNNNSEDGRSVWKSDAVKEVEPIHRLRYYANCWCRGKYDQARNYFDQYLVAPPGWSAKKMRQSCDSISRWQTDSARYTLQSSTINSGQSNFSPVWYKEESCLWATVVCKGINKTYQWTGPSVLICITAKETAKAITANRNWCLEKLNGIYHTKGRQASSSKEIRCTSHAIRMYREESKEISRWCGDPEDLSGNRERQHC